MTAYREGQKGCLVLFQFQAHDNGLAQIQQFPNRAVDGVFAFSLRWSFTPMHHKMCRMDHPVYLAADSVLMSTLREYRLASEMVIAHIRNASFGPVELRNTHPFRRELAGRVHIFAHNGDLPGIEDRNGLDRSGFAVPVGNTDSEYAFCLLMQKLSRLWSDARAVPSLSARKKIITEFAQ